MNTSKHAVTEQQETLLKRMSELHVMRAGTVTKQDYPKRRARKAGRGATGPYFTWQGYRDGVRFAQRVSGQRARVLQHQIDARKEFEGLCKEYIRLGEALAERQERATASEEALKKGLNSRSNRAGKSRA